MKQCKVYTSISSEFYAAILKGSQEIVLSVSKNNERSKGAVFHKNMLS